MYQYQHINYKISLILILSIFLSIFLRSDFLFNLVPVNINLLWVFEELLIGFLPSLCL